MSILPPVPLSPDPTVTYKAPPFPDFADPLPTKTIPELPDELVPELKINMPLTPTAPALADCTRRTPLELTELYPDFIEIIPPSELFDVPAERIRSPPDPLFPDPT